MWSILLLTIFGIYFIDQTCCPLKNTYVLLSSSLLMVSLSLLLLGPTVSNHKHTDKPKFRAKSSIRPTPRSSTLMRPTASQLAKQNNARWLLEHVNLGALSSCQLDFIHLIRGFFCWFIVNSICKWIKVMIKEVVGHLGLKFKRLKDRSLMEVFFVR